MARSKTTRVIVRFGKCYIRYIGPGGRRVSEATDFAPNRKRDAAELAEQLAKEAREGKWVPRKDRGRRALAEVVAAVFEQPVATASEPTVSRVFEIYRARVMPTKHSQVWQQEGLRVVEPEFKDTPLSLMTWDRIDLWIDKLKTEMTERTVVEKLPAHRPKAGVKPKVTVVRKRRYSDDSVRRYVFFLSGVLDGVAKTREGRLLGLRPDQNPARGHLLPSKKVPVPVALTQEEVARLLAALSDNETLRRWALLMIKLGCRVEEAMTLTWAAVDVRRRTVTVVGKTGRRACAVDDELAVMLEEWKKHDKAKPEARVVGHRYADHHSASKGWRGVFRRAGLAAHTPRVLRRTFRTWAFDAGKRPEDIVEQTGHDITILIRYYKERRGEGRERAVAGLPRLEVESFAEPSEHARARAEGARVGRARRKAREAGQGRGTIAAPALR